MRQKSILILTLVMFARLLNGQTVHAVRASETDGIWHPVTAVVGGQPIPKEVLETIVLKISGNQYSVTVNGTPDKGTCIVDNSTTPSQMTITGTVGPNQGKTMLAILEITDDQMLRVCYDLSGKEFPKEFKAVEGTLHYLAEYRRELPKGAELKGQVLGVPEGDAIDLKTTDNKTYRIRLNGIDAPELQQAFGTESKDAVAKLISQKTVRVVTQGEDRIGLIIGDVFFSADEPANSNSEIHLNNYLVANGTAWHYVRFAPDNNTLADSQERARKKHLGLWSEANPTAPWDWRRQQAEKKPDQDQKGQK